jgi:hypothetical protein
MTVATPPYVQQGQTHTAALFRQATAAYLGVPAGATFAGGIAAVTAGGGHGVVGGVDLQVTQDTGANMNSKIAAGYCAVSGTENASQGTYLGYNDASVLVTHSASDPTNPRRDIVVMKVRDAFYSGASTDMSLAVVSGTAAASPVDPTPPANALVLSRVTVPAASTAVVNANITDLRTRVTAIGGTRTMTSTQRLSLSGANLYAGLSVYESDTSRTYRYDGTGWIIMGEPAVALTPTFTNVTVGNGTLIGSYHRSDGWMDLKVQFTLGTTSAMGSSPTLTLPVAYANGLEIDTTQNVLMYHLGQRWYGAPAAAGPTAIVLNSVGAANAVSVTATVPFTWGSGDILAASFRYQMVTPYS